MHCNFEKGSRNQHLQSTLLVGREGVTKKDNSVYALDNVDNSKRPESPSGETIRSVYVEERVTRYTIR